jgi:serine/threonine-protein kinase
LAASRWNYVMQAAPRDADAEEGDFAIKVARNCPANGRIARAMLVREAAVCKAVNHPHLQTILDDRSGETVPYLVSPYSRELRLARVAGTLESRNFGDVKQVQLDVLKVVWIVRQIAEALGSLHAAGWMHGALSPDAINLSPGVHATLIELGQARRVGTAECQSDEPGWSDARYAAPEFVSSGRVSTASDIYSLGAVLFELLAGRLPFDGCGRGELARQHMAARPAELRRLRPGVSMEAAELVRRMLAKEPLRRPAATEVVQWLLEVEIAELATS